MTIEELYSGRNVEDFYIGKITQVYRSCCVAQVDNVQLMSNRERFSTSFLPNTINYFVIIVPISYKTITCKEQGIQKEHL